MNREKNVGGFLGETFALVRKNVPAIAMVILLLGSASAIGVHLGVMKLDDTFTSFGTGFAFDGDYDLATIVYLLCVFVLSMVAYCLLSKQLLSSNRRLTERDPRILAYIGLYILSLLGVMAGLLLLVIPGVFLLIKWSASVGFLIGERETIIDSLAKSWDATEGFEWSIFLSGLVLGVGLFLFQGITSGAAGFIGSQTLATFVTGLAESLQSAIFAAFGIAVFSLLHDNTEAVAAVFD